MTPKDPLSRKPEQSYSARAAKQWERAHRDDPTTVTLPRYIWKAYLRGQMPDADHPMVNAVKEALRDL